MATILCLCGHVMRPCRLWFCEAAPHAHCPRCDRMTGTNATTVEHIRRRVVPQAVK